MKTAYKWLLGLLGYFLISRPKQLPSNSRLTKREQRVIAWEPKVSAEIKRKGLPASVFLPLALSTIDHESGGNPAAKGPTNDGGLFQFIPSTAAMYGLSKEDRFNPDKSITAGIALLSDLYRKYNQEPYLSRGGALKFTFSAYNAGSGSVKKNFPNVSNTKYVATAQKGYEKWKKILGL